MFDYDGQEGDLSFKEGDVIIIAKQEEDSEWWEGSLNGTQGMFPANYVEIRELTSAKPIKQHFAQVSKNPKKSLFITFMT